MNQIDKELVARAQLGVDDRAFNRLVVLHQSAVRGFLRRLTKGDLALTDDLAQDTFFQAYTRLNDFRGDGHFQGWLLRIAYSMFLQYKRKRMNAEIPNDEIENLRGGAQAAISQHYDPMTARMDLERAMTQLNENERASISLCFTYGMSHGEAADVLNIPLGTVKSHISRGREKLKQILAIWQGEMIS